MGAARPSTGSATEQAHRALTEDRIAGAGLDDIEEEPAEVRDSRPDNPLPRLDNVVITPHAAYYSEERSAP